MGRKLTFFDVKAKRKFSTSKYVKVKRKVRGSTTTFAVARSPFSGIKCYRVLKRGKRRGRG
ncbi:MAG: hypothetical protein DRP01_11130 [Archaeoglobales archaeon]|nr:MAG: hypothetical protein DRP01_11130 [Archaeoglobales archaeon]